MIEILIVRGRGYLQLRAEVLALRHQLGVLEHQVGRPRWQATDRLLLAAISRALPKPAWRSLLPSPETLLRWHRELVRCKWAAYRGRPRRQRPELWHLLAPRLIIDGSVSAEHRTGHGSAVRAGQASLQTTSASVSRCGLMGYVIAAHAMRSLGESGRDRRSGVRHGVTLRCPAWGDHPSVGMQTSPQDEPGLG